MKCPRCSRENLVEALKCVGCGAFLASTSTQSVKLGNSPASQSTLRNSNTARPLPHRIQVIPPSGPAASSSSIRGTSRKGGSPRFTAGLIVVGILALGILLGIRTGSSESEPSETQQVMPNDSSRKNSEQEIVSTETVSGVNVAGSIVQIVVFDGSEVCGSGSGSVVIDTRHVLTSYHVVSESEDCRISEVFVETIEQIDQPPRRTFEATILDFDEEADIAILGITPITDSVPLLAPVKVSTQVGLGDRLTAIGFPAIGGSTVTVTTGEVSGFSNYKGVRWIKSSVSISGGNSGGGAFNTAGELVGVPSFFGSADSEAATDCRPIDDTNGNGIVDENDACVPMGGFINSLSPGASVQELIDRVVGN